MAWRGVTTVVPYDTYRIYQIERTRSSPRSGAPTSKPPSWLRCLIAVS
jgi:hypothetical protein